MGDYVRSTREIRLEALPSDIHTAIQRHLEIYNLGPILDDYLMGIETISNKRKKGLFKGTGKKQVSVYAFLTPKWLVYAVVGKVGSAGAMSVPLVEASIEDYAQTPFYSKMPDNGYYIKGNFTGQVGMQGQRHVSIFLGLGEERAAHDFRDLLEDAIDKTRR
jgi:hypothetical protein